jgi:hypothetical protein
MRKALRQLGMLAEVRAIIAAASEVTQEEWEYAIRCNRADPFWDALGAQMNPSKTAAQIDNLFRLAATK